MSAPAPRRLLVLAFVLGGCGTLVPYSAAPFGLADSVVPETPASTVTVTAAEPLPLGGRGSIRGRVLDLTMGTPLPGASVRLADGSASASAGPDGTFRLTGLAPGPVLVDAEAPGHTPVRAAVHVGRDSLHTALVLLAPTER